MLPGAMLNEPNGPAVIAHVDRSAEHRSPLHLRAGDLIPCSIFSSFVGGSTATLRTGTAIIRRSERHGTCKAKASPGGPVSALRS